MSDPRNAEDAEFEKAMACAIAKANVELVDDGLLLVEATCPICKSPDVSLKHKGPFGEMKCWDCGTIYRLTGDGSEVAE